MNTLDTPVWSDRWSYFATWSDSAFAAVSLLFILLILIWWRQQTRHWFRVLMITLLFALLMSIASYYLFVTPIHYANCPQGCAGWRGYPRPIAHIALDGVTHLGVIDFALNVLLLWLLWLVTLLLWRIASVALQWERQPRNVRVLLLVLVFFLPWAWLPRILNPPQPTLTGENQRLAINALRAAEFTYRITGFWVQRLAVEDVKQLEPAAETNLESVNRVGSQVCLRGYTYFFFPWRRYRIDLDGIGRTALKLTELPLDEACWGDGEREDGSRE
ncbi:MAG: hypothetical protein R3C14_46415 [Caldilineaceae bacterium]